MLLIPSASYRAPDFMEAAGRLGVEVVVGSDRRHPLEDFHAGRQVALDFVDLAAGTDRIEAFADLFPLDAIVGVDDGGALLAAAASRRLELPHNPLAAVEATRNKLLLRRTLAAAGLASPRFWDVAIGADPAKIAGRLEFPVVLKPLALSGSRGVMRADNAESFCAAFERLKHIIEEPANALECGELAERILVESYVPGVEVSVEGLLDNGRFQVLAIFDKPDPLEGPFFEETIYVTPSRLAEAEQRLIARTAGQAALALGLRDGPVHAELRLNHAGVFPIDIAARSIGGLCSRTLHFGAGMSLEEIILRHAIGADPPLVSRESAAAGVMMIPIPSAGTLRTVTGIPEAEAIPLIESVTISIHVGGEVVSLPEGSEYLGFIMARGETPAEVESALREAHAKLHFEIE
jgi:biotin carboxylase